MSAPTAPIEQGGDKVLFSAEDQGGGVLASALFRAIALAASSDATYNLAHLGVATHKDGATWAAASGGVVVAAGWNGASPGTVRKMLVDDSGRQVLRPLALYDGGGATPAYAELRAIQQASVAGLPSAHLGVATHADGLAWASGNPMVATGGVLPVGNLVKAHAVDTAGRQRVHEDYTLGGTGYVAVVSSHTAVPLRATTPARKLQIRASITNAAALYLGISTVTDGTAPTTSGYQLNAGGAIVIELGVGGDLANVFVNGIGADSASYIFWT